MLWNEIELKKPHTIYNILKQHILYRVSIKSNKQCYKFCIKFNKSTKPNRKKQEKNLPHSMPSHLSEQTSSWMQQPTTESPPKNLSKHNSSSLHNMPSRPWAPSYSIMVLNNSHQP